MHREQEQSKHTAIIPRCTLPADSNLQLWDFPSPFKCTHVNINTFAMKSKPSRCLKSVKSTPQHLGYCFTPFHTDE